MTQVQNSSEEQGDIDNLDEDEATTKLKVPLAIESLPALIATEALTEKTVELHLSDLSSLEIGNSDTEEKTLEGMPLEGATLVTAKPPTEGSTLQSDAGETVLLEQLLGEQNGSLFYRARVGDEEQPYTAIWSSDPPPEPLWTHLPDPRIVRPRCRCSMESAALRVFGRPRGTTLVDYLHDPEKFLPAMACLELGIELAEIIEGLHGAGLYIYDLDPSQIVIEKGGRVRLYAINGFHTQERIPPSVGPYAAPEVRRRIRYLTGAHSDVFSVAYLLYSLLARRPPVDVALDANLLQNPRIFRKECPLGIWPNLLPSLTAEPKDRRGFAAILRRDLLRARERLLREAQIAQNPEPLVLEAWAEVHRGLMKARRGADQQDRAICMTSEDAEVGLYVIADGVSRSKYGDGTFAAEQVHVVATQRWTALSRVGDDGLRLPHAQRVDVLRQIARSAGKKIAAEINNKYAPIDNEPNQVMSTTIVGAFIVDGDASLVNLGDSRAYLVRDASIERVSIDHDRTTDALRMGLSFEDAANVRMGSALTRVVGRVIIDGDGTCRPDPFEPDVFHVRLQPGDRLLICSDGVADFTAGAGATTLAAEQAMLDTLLQYEDPARAAFELVVLANRAGGYDNISCVVIAAHPA